MKTLGTHAFVNQVLVGLIVTIGFGGSVGLGTVWMRHQISVVADTNAKLQSDIVRIERSYADTKALVDEAMRSDVLRRKNESMRLGMVDLNPSQVIAINEDPVLRLAARASRRVFEGEGLAVGRLQLNVPITAQPVVQPDGKPSPAQPAIAAKPGMGPATVATFGSLQFAVSH